MRTRPCACLRVACVGDDGCDVEHAAGVDGGAGQGQVAVRKCCVAEAETEGVLDAARVVPAQARASAHTTTSALSHAPVGPTEPARHVVVSDGVQQRRVVVQRDWQAPSRDVYAEQCVGDADAAPRPGRAVR